MFIVYIPSIKRMNHKLCRLHQLHNCGKGKHIDKGFPWDVVPAEASSSIGVAIQREKFIKKKKSRIFIPIKYQIAQG